ncbi:ubiquitin carboxyl-terminal hydrolase 45 isoform X4 [Lepidochelys kempii]|uniref:ubiquitin carboxyl-terminal hydrolase 45 isoform X4 n=1 Tax=Lepidochelys kempii TaxID=8472 RepID=UPI003C6F1585
MRVKDPSRANPEKNKRNKRPKRHQDEDSSDDIAGLTCQHVNQAVDVHRVKRAVAQNVWSICSECLKERRINDGDPVIPSDIWLCLKCGSQGCSQNSEGQHSLKHFQTARTEPHCIVINISTWIIWCYECDEELSTHCNKKVLAQIVDFLQKHVTRTEPSSSSKIIQLHEENSEGSEILKGKSSANGASVPVKGINNLGNTCFFNAVMQNLAQTHMLNELMYEMKEKGIKLKISQAEDAQLDPLVVNLSSPGPLTSAMFLFLHSMRETGKGPLSPKVLFSQLCQKAPRFKGFQQQDSQELLHYLLDAMRIEETKRIQAGILKAFNNPTTKTADEETKRKVKAYGREGVKMNFIDRIFVGELTSTVMCEECENISTVKEPFIDLSLPIIEERVSKPMPLGRTSKCKNVQEADLGQFNCSSITAPNNQQPKITRRHSLTKDKNQLNHERSLARKSSSGEEERSPVIMHEKRKLEVEGGSGVLYSEAINTATESTANGSQTEGSEKEVSRSESSVDADSEASEEKKTEGLYTNARKQLLISAVPAILVLHLKRFHQAGLSLRKVNRHVDFPLILDLAPFCSASCKNVTDAARVLYTLYGIVEHSGSMRGGHYAAYVKVRTPCKKLLEHIASNRNVQGMSDKPFCLCKETKLIIATTHPVTVLILNKHFGPESSHNLQCHASC